VVLENCHVGKHAKTYADNDKMAAARIALVYLAGNAPCVWVPEQGSRQRRELLHAYRKAVADPKCSARISLCMGDQSCPVV
jgi:transposase